VSIFGAGRTPPREFDCGGLGTKSILLRVRLEMTGQCAFRQFGNVVAIATDCENRKIIMMVRAATGQISVDGFQTMDLSRFHQSI